MKAEIEKITQVKDLTEVKDLDQVINTYVHAHGSETYKHIQIKFWAAIEAIQKQFLATKAVETGARWRIDLIKSQQKFDEIFDNPNLKEDFENWFKNKYGKKFPIPSSQEAGEEAGELWNEILNYLNGEYAQNPATTKEEIIRDLLEHYKLVPVESYRKSSGKIEKAIEWCEEKESFSKGLGGTCYIDIKEVKQILESLNK